MAGAGIREYKRRIRSVKNTQQITKAMKMVSAAKLRRAQEAAEASRPYTETLQGTLARLAGVAYDVKHPLLEKREEVRKVGYVTFAILYFPPLFRASAPPTISRISSVMAACLALFIARVRDSMISPALSVALPMAVILAPCSLALPSSMAL
jgi:hypothetical protein